MYDAIIVQNVYKQFGKSGLSPWKRLSRIRAGSKGFAGNHPAQKGKDVFLELTGKKLVKEDEET